MITASENSQEILMIAKEVANNQVLPQYIAKENHFCMEIVVGLCKSLTVLRPILYYAQYFGDILLDNVTG